MEVQKSGSKLFGCFNEKVGKRSIISTFLLEWGEISDFSNAPYRDIWGIFESHIKCKHYLAEGGSMASVPCFMLLVIFSFWLGLHLLKRKPRSRVTLCPITSQPHFNVGNVIMPVWAPRLVTSNGRESPLSYHSHYTSERRHLPSFDLNFICITVTWTPNIIYLKSKGKFKLHLYERQPRLPPL